MIKGMSYHIITKNKQKNWTWDQKQSTLYKCSLKVLCEPWCKLCFGNTITKSNEDRVLDLIGVMPFSAEKE
jgi:hypothetical protein